jgi:nucleoid-associated protein YgaU
MTRENKLGLIIGFGIVLLVGVLISDHYSPATEAEFAALDPPDLVAPAPQETFEILQTEPLLARDPLPEETLAPAEEPQTQRPDERRSAERPPALANAAEDSQTETEPIVIGGSTEDFGQQIRELLGLTDAAAQPQAQPQPTRHSAQPEPATGITHTVRKGESLAAIARRYYRDTERWRQIYEANRHVLPSPDLVKEGTILRIPGIDAATAATTRPPANGRQRVDATARRTYTIQKGDVLGVVSQKLTGTSRNWRRIYEANRDVIDDPDRLIPGTVIRIPADLAFPG